MTDRGVSEVIAFILIFSIVITSVGLLYTAGFGSLTDIQESETDRSAQRAFGASAIALEDIQRGIGSHRAFNVELSGRTITVNDSPTLGVEVNGTSVKNSTGALVYGPGASTEIAYQSGAVIRSDGPDAQIVSRAPLFQCSGDHAVLSLVSIEGPGSSVSSDGSVQIVADGPQPGKSTLVPIPTETPDVNVTVNYGGNRYDTAWESYFDQNEWDSVDANEASCIADEVYVRHMTIELEYLGI